MIASKIRINGQITKIINLEDELDDLKEELEISQSGWKTDGVTGPLYLEELIFANRKEIEAEETKLAKMEATYDGREVERQKPWEKRRAEPTLFSFC